MHHTGTQNIVGDSLQPYVECFLEGVEFLGKCVVKGAAFVQDRAFRQPFERMRDVVDGNVVSLVHIDLDALRTDLLRGWHGESGVGIEVMDNFPRINDCVSFSAPLEAIQWFHT